MSVPIENNQAQDQKISDKELNFRAQQAKYEKLLAQANSEKEDAVRMAQEAQSRKIQEDDESDDEPYVDKKKLKKTLDRFGQSQQSEIQKAMDMAKQAAKEELKQEMWIENNPDFYDTLQLAEKFAQKAPKLAETILKMPNNFERQKLVYQNIKELGIDKPEVKSSSIQDKIDANKKSPYYQPSGVANSPYASSGDFSPSGQKNAYQKMQELKSKLRI